MENGKLRINMYSSADKVAGQGVGSAYEEQVALVRQADDLFDVEVNRPQTFSISIPSIRSFSCGCATKSR